MGTLGGTYPPKGIFSALGLWEGLFHSASLRSIEIVFKVLSHYALLRSFVIIHFTQVCELGSNVLFFFQRVSRGQSMVPQCTL